MSTIIVLPPPKPSVLPAHLITICPATHQRVVAALEAADEAVLAGWDLLAERLIVMARAEVAAVEQRIAH